MDIGQSLEEWHNVKHVGPIFGMLLLFWCGCPLRVCVQRGLHSTQCRATITGGNLDIFIVCVMPSCGYFRKEADMTSKCTHLFYNKVRVTTGATKKYAHALLLNIYRCCFFCGTKKRDISNTFVLLEILAVAAAILCHWKVGQMQVDRQGVQIYFNADPRTCATERILGFVRTAKFLRQSGEVSLPPTFYLSSFMLTYERYSNHKKELKHKYWHH